MPRRFKYDKYRKGDNVVYRMMIPPEQIQFFCATVEAYDGVGLVRTIDSRRAVVEVLVVGDQKKTFEGLIDSLKRQIGIEVIANP